MTFDPILHHHDPSPFAEKIRKAFGIKGVSWRSVQVPMVMPKPDLTALTGGYRGAPVMQVGADIYCDTRCIIAEIERRAPAPSLFMDGPLINFAAQHWSDEAVFPSGAALSMYENRAHIPDAVIDDREAYFRDLDFARFEQDAPHYRNQFRAHAALIEKQLSDGRPFLAGEAPQWIDLGAWFNVFMAAENIPSSERLFDGMTNLRAWRDRMEAFGHGDRKEITAEDALAAAQSADPLSIEESAADESAASAGAAVTVAPVDHPDTIISGALVRADADTIVIHRTDIRLGALAVHFPRIGYRIEPAGNA